MVSLFKTSPSEPRFRRIQVLVKNDERAGVVRREKKPLPSGSGFLDAISTIFFEGVDDWHHRVAGSSAFLDRNGLAVEETDFALHHFFADDVLAALLQVGELVLQLDHDLLDDAAQCAGAGVAFEGAFSDQPQGALRE